VVLVSKATAIYLDRDTDVDTFDSGDEIDVWTVCAGDDDGDPVGKVYTCRSADAAWRLARNMSRDRRLEIVTN
jgi:hypothetical protein